MQRQPSWPFWTHQLYAISDGGPCAGQQLSQGPGSGAAAWRQPECGGCGSGALPAFLPDRRWVEWAWAPGSRLACVAQRTHACSSCWHASNCMLLSLCDLVCGPPCRRHDQEQRGEPARVVGFPPATAVSTRGHCYMCWRAFQPHTGLMRQACSACPVGPWQPRLVNCLICN
jgi:hypothetical protein